MDRSPVCYMEKKRTKLYRKSRLASITLVTIFTLMLLLRVGPISTLLGFQSNELCMDKLS